eukprot:g506.t1
MKSQYFFFQKLLLTQFHLPNILRISYIGATDSSFCFLSLDYWTSDYSKTAYKCPSGRARRRNREGETHYDEEECLPSPGKYALGIDEVAMDCPVGTTSPADGTPIKSNLECIALPGWYVDMANGTNKIEKLSDRFFQDGNYQDNTIVSERIECYQSNPPKCGSNRIECTPDFDSLELPECGKDFGPNQPCDGTGASFYVTTDNRKKIAHVNLIDGGENYNVGDKLRFKSPTAGGKQHYAYFSVVALITDVPQQCPPGTTSDGGLTSKVVSDCYTAPGFYGDNSGEGRVVTLQLVSPGNGYVTGTMSTTSSSLGTGLTVQLEAANIGENGSLTGASVMNGGWLYSVGDFVYVKHSGDEAKFQVTSINNASIACPNGMTSNGGRGITTIADCFTAPGYYGIGRVAESNGIQIVNAGTGYTDNSIHDTFGGQGRGLKIKVLSTGTEGQILTFSIHSYGAGYIANDSEPIHIGYGNATIEILNIITTPLQCPEGTSSEGGLNTIEEDCTVIGYYWETPKCVKMQCYPKFPPDPTQLPSNLFDCGGFNEVPEPNPYNIILETDTALCLEERAKCETFTNESACIVGGLCEWLPSFSTLIPTLTNKQSCETATNVGTANERVGIWMIPSLIPDEKSFHGYFNIIGSASNTSQCPLGRASPGGSKALSTDCFILPGYENDQRACPAKTTTEASGVEIPHCLHEIITPLPRIERRGECGGEYKNCNEIGQTCIPHSEGKILDFESILPSFTEAITTESSITVTSCIRNDSVCSNVSGLELKLNSLILPDDITEVPDDDGNPIKNDLSNLPDSIKSINGSYYRIEIEILQRGFGYEVNDVISFEVQSLLFSIKVKEIDGDIQYRCMKRTHKNCTSDLCWISMRAYQSNILVSHDKSKKGLFKYSCDKIGDIINEAHICKANQWQTLSPTPILTKDECNVNTIGKLRKDSKICCPQSYCDSFTPCWRPGTNCTQKCGDAVLKYSGQFGCDLGYVLKEEAFCEPSNMPCSAENFVHYSDCCHAILGPAISDSGQNHCTQGYDINVLAKHPGNSGTPNDYWIAARVRQRDCEDCHTCTPINVQDDSSLCSTNFVPDIPSSCDSSSCIFTRNAKYLIFFPHVPNPLQTVSAENVIFCPNRDPSWGFNDVYNHTELPNIHWPPKKIAAHCNDMSSVEDDCSDGICDGSVRLIVALPQTGQNYNTNQNNVDTSCTRWNGDTSTYENCNGLGNTVTVNIEVKGDGSIDTIRLVNQGEGYRLNDILRIDNGGEIHTQAKYKVTALAYEYHPTFIRNCKMPTLCSDYKDPSTGFSPCKDKYYQEEVFGQEFPIIPANGVYCNEYDADNNRKWECTLEKDFNPNHSTEGFLGWEHTHCCIVKSEVTAATGSYITGIERILFDKFPKKIVKVTIDRPVTIKYFGVEELTQLQGTRVGWIKIGSDLTTLCSQVQTIECANFDHIGVFYDNTFFASTTFRRLGTYCLCYDIDQSSNLTMWFPQPNITLRVIDVTIPNIIHEIFMNNDTKNADDPPNKFLQLKRSAAQSGSSVIRLESQTNRISTGDRVKWILDSLSCYEIEYDDYYPLVYDPSEQAARVPVNLDSVGLYKLCYRMKDGTDSVKQYGIDLLVTCDDGISVLPNLREGVVLHPSNGNSGSANPTCQNMNIGDKCMITCDVGFSGSSTETMECTESGWAIPENMACIMCEAGRHQDIQGQDDCRTCPQGFYQDRPGQKNCIPCVRGKFLPADTPFIQFPANHISEDQCLLCEENTYSSKEGSGSCEPCPFNSFTFHTSISTHHDFHECEKGPDGIQFNETNDTNYRLFKGGAKSQTLYVQLINSSDENRRPVTPKCFQPLGITNGIQETVRTTDEDGYIKVQLDHPDLIFEPNFVHILEGKETSETGFQISAKAEFILNNDNRTYPDISVELSTTTDCLNLPISHSGARIKTFNFNSQISVENAPSLLRASVENFSVAWNGDLSKELKLISDVAPDEGFYRLKFLQPDLSFYNGSEDETDSIDIEMNGFESQPFMIKAKDTPALFPEDILLIDIHLLIEFFHESTAVNLGVPIIEVKSNVGEDPFVITIQKTPTSAYLRAIIKKITFQEAITTCLPIVVDSPVYQGNYTRGQLVESTATTITVIQTQGVFTVDDLVPIYIGTSECVGTIQSVDVLDASILNNNATLQEKSVDAKIAILNGVSVSSEISIVFDVPALCLQSQSEWCSNNSSLYQVTPHFNGLVFSPDHIDFTAGQSIATFSVKAAGDSSSDVIPCEASEGQICVQLEVKAGTPKNVVNLKNGGASFNTGFGGMIEIVSTNSMVQLLSNTPQPLQLQGNRSEAEVVYFAFGIAPENGPFEIIPSVEPNCDDCFYFNGMPEQDPGNKIELLEGSNESSFEIDARGGADSSETYTIKLTLSTKFADNLGQTTFDLTTFQTIDNTAYDIEMKFGLTSATSFQVQTFGFETQTIGTKIICYKHQQDTNVEKTDITIQISPLPPLNMKFTISPQSPNAIFDDSTPKETTQLINTVTFTITPDCRQSSNGVIEIEVKLESTQEVKVLKQIVITSNFEYIYVPDRVEILSSDMRVMRGRTQDQSEVFEIKLRSSSVEGDDSTHAIATRKALQEFGNLRVDITREPFSSSFSLYSFLDPCHGVTISPSSILISTQTQSDEREFKVIAQYLWDTLCNLKFAIHYGQMYENYGIPDASAETSHGFHLLGTPTTIAILNSSHDIVKGGDDSSLVEIEINPLVWFRSDEDLKKMRLTPMAQGLVFTENFIDINNQGQGSFVVRADSTAALGPRTIEFLVSTDTTHTNAYWGQTTLTTEPCAEYQIVVVE